MSAGITHWPHGVPGGRELEAAHRPHRAPDDQEPKAWMQRTGRTGCRVAGGASSLVSGRSGQPRPEGTRGAGAAPRLPGDLEGGGGRPVSRRTGRSGGAGKVGAALMEDPRPERGGCVHCSERNRQSQLGNESSGRSPASGCRGRGRAPSARRGRRPWRHMGHGGGGLSIRRQPVDSVIVGIHGGYGVCSEG